MVVIVTAHRFSHVLSICRIIVDFDISCKNVSRVCYESYDPLIYINEQSSIFNQIIEQEYQEVIKHKDVQTIPITDENKIVEILTLRRDRKFEKGS